LSENSLSAGARVTGRTGTNTTFAILVSLSVCHLLNDMNQSLVPALYPILKDSYRLDFGQIGLLTLAFQLTASMLQPVVGMVTDMRPQPYSLPIAMGCSLIGLLLLSVANNYPTILLAAALVGLGSSVFHPESSRVARMASGGRHGFAQSLFQVGAAPVRPSDRCSPRSSWCREGRRALPGSRPPHCSRSCC
jgi:MFS transporter, FSR family, fosmidomycin resistance protein